MSAQSVAEAVAKPAQPGAGDTRALTVERAPCLLRDHPREASRRVMLIFRRGPPEQSRPWLGSAGTTGPVLIVGLDQWAGFEMSVEKAADGFIEALDLRGREVELCLTGGGMGSFYAMIIGALLAERLAPMPVKVVAFSVVAQVCNTVRGNMVFHPAIPMGLRNKPQTLAAMRKFPAVRPFLEQAAAGGNLKVKVFGTPIALLEWQQFLLIEDVSGVSVEEVLADDINQDMMSWLMLSPNDAPASRERLIRWTAARNPGWAPRVVAAKVDRELPVALAWRKTYPSLASTFDKM
jgi:hypothetical protein